MTGKRKKTIKSSPAARAAGDETDLAVAEFLRKLKHPLKKEIEAARQTILGVSPSIGESIKWNSLSFRAQEDFATLNWRYRDGVQFVFHTGAKGKSNARELRIPDPAKLIKWIATDRCLVTLAPARDGAINRAAFAAIVRAWIRQL